jgi:four helix bundle protein
VAIKRYRDLEVYQRAKALVVPMYRLAESFPKHEQFDLCDQIRRASKSVVANIVEGYSHKETPAKAKQFWRIAMGSANEMIEHLETAVALAYISPDTCRSHIEEYTAVAKQLNRLIHTWHVLQPLTSNV